MKRIYAIASLLTSILLWVGLSAQAGGPYQEAPELAEKVARGELPPVEERLPPEPVVVDCYEKIGTYGGTWNRMMKGPTDIHCFTRIANENLLRWPADLKDDLVPGLLDRWEFNDTFTTLTLHVREGMRWSDGAPFSADDVMFWWEHIANDKNVSPAIQSHWKPGGKPVKLTQIDKYTLRMEFVAPYPKVLEYLCFKCGQWPLGFDRFGAFAPKHYLAPYHPGCEVERPEGVAPSYKAFEDKASDFNTERPVMTAWQITTWEPGRRLVATRNPYYWKVDREGNQLPYIDTAQYEVFYNDELMNLRALTGKIDMQMRHFRTEDLDLLRDFSKKRGYRVIQYETTNMNSVALNLEYRGENPSDPDASDAARAAMYRFYFQDVRFRRALSLAIDRELIRDLIFKGNINEATFGYGRYSKYYTDDSDLREYLKYDPARANALLDEAGLTRRDSNGYRVMKNGDTMSLIIELSASSIDQYEIVRAGWEAVGIKTTVKQQDRTINVIRTVNAGLFMASSFGTDSTFPVLTQDMRFAVEHGGWGHFYWEWYSTGGRKGVEPTPLVKRCQKIYEEMKATNDILQLKKLARELSEIHAENVFYFPITGPGRYIGIVKDNMRNVPPEGFGAWTVFTPGNKNPHTFFFENPDGETADGK